MTDSLEPLVVVFICRFYNRILTYLWCYYLLDLVMVDLSLEMIKREMQSINVYAISTVYIFYDINYCLI